MVTLVSSRNASQVGRGPIAHSLISLPPCSYTCCLGSCLSHLCTLLYTDAQELLYYCLTCTTIWHNTWTQVLVLVPSMDPPSRDDYATALLTMERSSYCRWCLAFLCMLIILTDLQNEHALSCSLPETITITASCKGTARSQILLLPLEQAL